MRAIMSRAKRQCAGEAGGLVAGGAGAAFGGAGAIPGIGVGKSDAKRGSLAVIVAVDCSLCKNGWMSGASCCCTSVSLMRSRADAIVARTAGCLELTRMMWYPNGDLTGWLI
jgi:hypothetical protein